MAAFLYCILAFGVPRITMAIMYFMGKNDGVFEGYFWAIVGWFFMPWTTFAYILTQLNVPDGSLWWVVLIAVFVDIIVGAVGQQIMNSEK